MYMYYYPMCTPVPEFCMRLLRMQLSSRLTGVFRACRGCSISKDINTGTIIGMCRVDFGFPGLCPPVRPRHHQRYTLTDDARRYHCLLRYYCTATSSTHIWASCRPVWGSLCIRAGLSLVGMFRRFCPMRSSGSAMCCNCSS